LSLTNTNLPCPALSSEATVVAQVDANGVLTARPEAVIDAMTAKDKAEIDLAKGVAPLPIFHAAVGNGKVALVSMKVSFNSGNNFVGLPVENLVLLKLTSANATERLNPTTDPKAITEGRFVLTDKKGSAIPAGTLITANAEYIFSVAIRDDSPYDWDATSGSVIDPLALAELNATAADTNTGNSDGAGTGGKSGGCDAGAAGFVALLAAAIITRKK
jgi:hypothetical protein